MAIPVILKTIPEHARIWHHVFSREAPELRLIDWEHGTPFPGVSAFASWHPPADLAAQMPDLRLVFSVGAGIDLLPLDALPEHVDIVRMVAPNVTRSMVEYVTLGVLALHRDLVLYANETRRGIWNPRAIRTARTTHVGVLGLGVLGSAAAAALAGFGFKVRGWARSPKTVDGVTCFAGRAALPDFLSCCDILVCLLPLTPETRGLLDRDLFRHLPLGAALLNAGRGAHIVESDLIAALDTGQLGAAILDVLTEEPPPTDHPLLGHPKIIVTPHSASANQPDAAAHQMIAAVRACRDGQPFLNRVDRSRGF
ncbi:2-hydroxyacid dehydrogenase [Methylobacterium pseudosasicola]|uniref:Glyoxylate/hydroxypyruvate reductase A n=1 Tax=Methylobacterium pseudosasicola TaxID=582667 RepID=A0A1I4SQ12_9HYPH|nr:glyoxylate/hydroxypyruvate reductase A [Methylobacterium pseudosasicola]SFM66471.1 glyoxylate/hydroxypyruvate reductase A [Methylobacterium pseudosasicola]